MVVPMFFARETSTLSKGSEFRLTGEEGKHAAVVRRMRVGEAIQLTDGAGFRATGKISSVEASGVVVRIEETTFETAPKLQLTLVQALAKGDRDELAVQAATELGAVSIIPWQAARSISRWEGVKAEKGRIRWQTIATEAAKQSLRVWEPKIASVVSSKELSQLIRDFDSVLILDPTGAQSLASLPAQIGRIAIVVGPEGGIDPSELGVLETAGAMRVHLGNGILRTSTAGLAAISFLQGVSGLWNTAE
jgi:16S rRNA (uracil1498-N3)-methyltransferase